MINIESLSNRPLWLCSRNIIPEEFHSVFLSNPLLLEHESLYVEIIVVSYDPKQLHSLFCSEYQDLSLILTRHHINCNKIISSVLKFLLKFNIRKYL